MMVVVMICADILICIQSCIHLLSLTAVKDCIAAHKFHLPRSSQFHLQALINYILIIGFLTTWISTT